MGDIYLNAGGTGMVKGALYSTASPTVYNLGVTGLAAEGDVSVSLAKAGYAFKPASRAARANGRQGPGVSSDISGSPVTYAAGGWNRTGAPIRVMVAKAVVKTQALQAIRALSSSAGPT